MCKETHIEASLCNIIISGGRKLIDLSICWCWITVVYHILEYYAPTEKNAAAAAKLLQSCLTLCNPRQQPTRRLCAAPQTAAHQAPPSLGFSTQEHWSGVPFPSPLNESEK